VSDTSAQNPHMVALGIIRKAIGLNGLCAVEVFGETFGQLEVPGEVLVGRNENICRTITIEHIEFRPKGPVCFFKDITDRDGAETLRNQYIYLRYDELPKLESDSFYHFELMGKKVLTDNGQLLGNVTAVHNFPTVDSIEIGVGHESIMIPLTAEALETIDKVNGRIIVKHAFIEELL